MSEAYKTAKLSAMYIGMIWLYVRYASTGHVPGNAIARFRSRQMDVVGSWLQLFVEASISMQAEAGIWRASNLARAFCLLSLSVCLSEQLFYAAG